MALRNWFRGSDEGPDEKLEVEDLIVLERYDEAEARLRRQLDARSDDLHSRLRLAEVLQRKGELAAACEELVAVADGYARDGFHDRAIAVLTKVRRMVPGDAAIPARLHRLERSKRLDQLRTLAVEGLERAMERSVDRFTPMDVQGYWEVLAESPLVERLEGRELRQLLGAMDLVRFQADGVLARRGEQLERLYFLLTGQVEAEVGSPAGGPPVGLRTLAAGDVFGDEALLRHLPWPVTCRAGAPTVVLALGPRGFEEALVGNPDPRGLVDCLGGQGCDASLRQAAQAIVE